MAPATVSDDDLYERYLQRAIREINDLQRELTALADETHIPVLGSGHPLADVFLLKHKPVPTEITEGVAFFGRAGHALIKSMERLGVDPTAVYGTNCFKFGTEEPELAASWLTRELQITQPRLVVVMGSDSVAFLERPRVPARTAAGRRAPGRDPALHTDDRGARHPGYRRVARRDRRQEPLLGGVPAAGRVVGEAATVLSTRRLVALAVLLTTLVAWDAGAGALPALSDDWDVGLTAIVLIPATFAVVWLLLPLAATRAAGPLALVLGLLALGAWLVGAGALFNVAKLCALTLAGFWFLSLFEALSWIVLVACVIPWVDVLSVYRGPDQGRRRAEARPLRADLDRVPAPGGGLRRPARAAGRAVLRAVPGEHQALRAPRRLDVGRDDLGARAHARRDVRLRSGRAPRAAGDRARLPRAERRPDLAGPDRPEERGAAAARIDKRTETQAARGRPTTDRPLAPRSLRGAVLLRPGLDVLRGLLVLRVG